MAAGADFRVVVVSMGSDVLRIGTDVEVKDRAVIITPYHVVKKWDTRLEVVGGPGFFHHEADLRFDEPGPVEIRIRTRGSDLVYTVQVIQG